MRRLRLAVFARQVQVENVQVNRLAGHHIVQRCCTVDGMDSEVVSLQVNNDLFTQQTIVFDKSDDKRGRAGF